jgi:hypothetical protein
MFIKILKDPNDEWVEGTTMLKPLSFYYFSNISRHRLATDPALLEKIQTKVTHDMNERPVPINLHVKIWSLYGEQIILQL